MKEFNNEDLTSHLHGDGEAERYAAHSIEDRLVFSARMSSASRDDCALMDEAATEISRLRELLSLRSEPVAGLDGNDIWEWLFCNLEGDVPAMLDDGLLGMLALHIRSHFIPHTGRNEDAIDKNLVWEGVGKFKAISGLYEISSSQYGKDLSYAGTHVGRFENYTNAKKAAEKHRLTAALQAGP